MAEPTRAMTLRLPMLLANDLALVASIDGLDVTEVVRQAVAVHLAARTADPDFCAAARSHVADVRALIGDKDA